MGLDEPTKQLVLVSYLYCNLKAVFNFRGSLGSVDCLSSLKTNFMQNKPPPPVLILVEMHSKGLDCCQYILEWSCLSQIIMYNDNNVVNDHAPDYLCSNMKMVHTQHNHNARASVRSCKVPRVQNAASSTFIYTGMLLWSSLPPVIIKLLNC